MQRARGVFFAFLLTSFGAVSLAQAVVSPPASGERGVAATAHPEATAAAIEMLRAGGNAVDAAVAAAFTLAVVEPYSSGIGGGGFALTDIDGKVRFLDFREVAPAKASAHMFVHDGKPDPLLSRDGALAVAVPGAVSGYLTLHKRYGKLKRDRVLAPAIRAAEQGLSVDSHYQTHARQRLTVLNRDPEARRIFLAPPGTGDPNGRAAEATHANPNDQVTDANQAAWEVPRIGHRVVQTDLAATLRAIAKSGASAFYRGPVAQAMVQDVQGRGGILTQNDLEAYKVRDREPLRGVYRGHRVITSPPPSSGGQILLTLLNVMETLPPATPWNDFARLHLYIEASKRAFADRALLGDPGFVKDLGATVAQLVAKPRGDALALAIGTAVTPADRIGTAEATPLAQPKAPAVRDPGTHTSHLSIVDAAGNAVSMTTTTNYLWGAAIVARGTGILLNDEMDDFSVGEGVPNVYGIVGSDANKVAAGKVPLSSMTPTLVFQDETDDSPLFAVIGSPGGSRIPTTVAQVLMAIVDHGVPVADALKRPRLHHQHLPDTVYAETGALDAGSRRALAEAGYHVDEGGMWCNASAVVIDPNTHRRTAAADPRGVGTAEAQ